MSVGMMITPHKIVLMLSGGVCYMRWICMRRGRKVCLTKILVEGLRIG